MAEDEKGGRTAELGIYFVAQIHEFMLRGQMRGKHVKHFRSVSRAFSFEPKRERLYFASTVVPRIIYLGDYIFVVRDFILRVRDFILRVRDFILRVRDFILHEQVLNNNKVGNWQPPFYAQKLRNFQAVGKIKSGTRDASFSF